MQRSICAIAHNADLPSIVGIFDKPFRIDSDASKLAMGAVPSQGAWDRERVVAYAGKHLTGRERKWIPYDRERWAIVWSVRHFRPYIAGSKFVVVTDHQPLVGKRNIDPANDPTGRRGRWTIDLSTYDFEIVYRKRKQHVNADALSRASRITMEDKDLNVGPVDVECKCTEQDKVSEIVKQAQSEDENLSKLKHWLEVGTKPPLSEVSGQNRDLTRLYNEYERCSLREGVIYRRVTDTNKLQERMQLILPQSMKQGVLHSLHNQSGHFAKVSDRYYLPGMAADVKRCCESSNACQRRRNPVPGMRAPPQPIVTTRPRELVTVDIVEYTKSDNGSQYALVLVDHLTKYLELVTVDIVEYTKSDNGNQYALVLGDHFTKYLKLYPMPDATALTAARKIFGEWVPRYGAPEQLHSDQGTNLNAKLIQEVCSLLQRWKIHSTPFHPQSDGATERVIRTVNAILVKCVAEKQKDWDVKLGPDTITYTSAVHESTGFTPYFLEHRREMRLPADLMGEPSPGHSCPVTKYGQELKKGLDSAFTMARDSLDASHRRQKAGYDKWARENPCKFGTKCGGLTRNPERVA